MSKYYWSDINTQLSERISISLSGNDNNKYIYQLRCTHLESVSHKSFRNGIKIQV